MRKWLGTLLLLAVSAVSPAHAAWREAGSQHFVIYSEQSASSLQQFAEDLERYDRGLRILFGGGDDQTSRASRVTVFVVDSMDAVRRLAGPNAPPGLGGFYRPWPQGPVAFIPRSLGAAERFGQDSKLVLQHEYAHHFLNQNFAAVFPEWLHEGFAEFASTADRRDNGMTFWLPAQHCAHSLLVGSPIAIERLLGPATSKRTREENAKFYARSWLLCHFLLVDPSGRGRLGSFIKRLNTGVGSLEAARAAFGDLNQLNKDLDSYLNRIRSKMTAFTLPLSTLPIGQVTIRELGPGESAMMHVRIESKAGVNRAEAVQVVARARKSAAAYPNDERVQAALAEAEFDAGNYAEAEAAADRALAADPKSIDATTYKGVARMRHAVMAEKRDPASWAEIRKWLLAANRLDPDDPEPLSYFFLSFLRQGIEPPANAVDAAMRALELAPQDTGLRITVVQYLLRHGKSAQARTALLRLASAPHGGELQEAAADMIAALDSGGTEAAMRLMAKRQQGRSNEEANPADREGS